MAVRTPAERLAMNDAIYQEGLRQFRENGRLSPGHVDMVNRFAKSGPKETEEYKQFGAATREPLPQSGIDAYKAHQEARKPTQQLNQFGKFNSNQKEPNSTSFGSIQIIPSYNTKFSSKQKIDSVSEPLYNPNNIDRLSNPPYNPRIIDSLSEKRPRNPRKIDSVSERPLYYPNNIDDLSKPQSKPRYNPNNIDRLSKLRYNNRFNPFYFDIDMPYSPYMDPESDFYIDDDDINILPQEKEDVRMGLLPQTPEQRKMFGLTPYDMRRS
jgi:hypothetical protein